MRLNRFAVLGRVGMDLHADPPGTEIDQALTYTAAIGGSAGNTAVALARQGAHASLLSKVSEDPVGRFCLAQLQSYGVDTRHVTFSRGETRTSLALTETRAPSCQTVLYRNGAADFDLTEADVQALDFAPLSALVVTGTALARDPSRQAATKAMARARQAGTLVVLDIDHRAYSWSSAAEAAQVCLAAAANADIVVGNDDEFALLAGTHAEGPGLARNLAMSGALFAVFKRGAQGCITFTPDYAFETGIFPVKTRKPTGAGDGFMGGMLAGLAQGFPLETAIRRGAATAALIVAGIGCAPASPDRAALDAFLAQG